MVGKLFSRRACPPSLGAWHGQAAGRASQASRLNGFIAFVCLISAGLAQGEGAPVSHPIANAYFPLAPGTTWKYLVTAEANDKPEKPYVQTLTVAPVEVGKEKSFLIDGDAYLTKEDGVYLLGRVGG